MDSTAAVTGALVGARVGVKGIPRQWLDDIVDWPPENRLKSARINRKRTTQKAMLRALPKKALPLGWGPANHAAGKSHSVT